MKWKFSKKRKKHPNEDPDEQVDKIYHRFFPWWKNLLYGTLQGLGMTVGAGLVLFLVGYILNILGYLPVIGDIAKTFKIFIENYRM